MSFSRQNLTRLACEVDQPGTSSSNQASATDRKLVFAAAMSARFSLRFNAGASSSLTQHAAGLVALIACGRERDLGIVPES